MPNYSLYTIPLSYILASIPHIFAFRLYITTTSKPFPSKAPRTFIAKVESDPALPASTRSQILGGEWAHANSMENIGLFAAAVVAANSAGVENWWLNVLSGGYCVARFVYNHVYIYQDKVPAALRSVVHTISLVCTMALYVLAGNEMRNRKE